MDSILKVCLVRFVGGTLRCRLSRVGVCVVAMDSSGEAEKEKELGNIAYKKREFTEAIAHYDKALEINPDHLAYLTNR